MENNNIPILQQDNSPVHTAKRIKSFLDDKNIQVMKWPALSPDLNPIENIWGFIKKKLSQNLNTRTTINDIRSEVHRIWVNLPQRYILSVVASMRSRMKQVINSSGEPIKY